MHHFISRALAPLLAFLLLTASLPAAAAPATPAAGAADTLIPPEEISYKRLKQVLEGALLDVRQDSDEMLIVEDGRQRTIIRLDPKSNLLTMFSLFDLNEKIDTERMLAFANRLNSDYNLVRYWIYRDRTLVCDYSLLTDRGITPRQLVDSYRRFVGYSRGALLNAGAAEMFADE